MSFITDLFSGGASKLISSIGDTVDKFVTTKEEKMQLENEMRKAEFEFQKEMRTLSVEERRLELGDIDSARKREMTTATSAEVPWYVKIVGPLLAVLGTLLCFTLFYILIFKKEVLPDGSKEIVLYILGVLSALLTQVYSYYFGSSQGSADKGKTLAAELAQKREN